MKGKKSGSFDVVVNTSEELAKWLQCHDFSSWQECQSLLRQKGKEPSHFFKSKDHEEVSQGRKEPQHGEKGRSD